MFCEQREKFKIKKSLEYDKIYRRRRKLKFILYVKIKDILISLRNYDALGKM